MSRKFTINGHEVTGCMNYICTPCPNLLVDSQKMVPLQLDQLAGAAGTRLSLYLKADTRNTQTPLRYYLHNVTPDAMEITPKNAKAGVRIDLPAGTAAGADGLHVNTMYGSYTIRRLAVMLTSEMDEIMQSEHPLDTDWSHWYPA